ncbi:MAG: hypothetical protein GWM98_09340, partial [Nitrospinaceae bacterium]|nr:hypothetical protein [Nitrospinaceae bacterium]NIR54660.1 hypothetical protein [Nitrospinaceae bacterium]NIS85077.1 hypothetical protein [Nitrospinaceae bacterium]NIT81894.1 hypothetical protein [Nitrospinaceae bacterium]NIU44158.1 hypothetical protein [Nitrospinaceae bacterium]
EGVLIPSDIVRKEIEKIKDQFPSEKLFESALKAQGMDRAALWEKLEKHLVAENYLRRAIAPQVDVDESDAQAFYNENPSRFTQPEMYEVRHIFVNAIDPSREGTADRPEDQEKADRIVKAVNEASREKIDQALKELEQGADFE